MEIKILPEKQMLEITWEDEHISKFHASWLRLNCDCIKCQGCAPGCFSVDVTKFPDDFIITDIEFNKDENLIMICIRDEPYIGHVTKLKPAELRQHCYCEECLQDKLATRDFLKNLEGKPKEVPQLDYNDANINSDDFYFRWMKTIFDYGYCRVVNFPGDDELFMKIARQLGDLENHPYTKGQLIGEIGNLSDKSHSGNTYQELQFHMDFMYLEGIGQIMLHNCIKFDPCVIGGESIIVDGFEAAETLRRESPEDFKILNEIPVLRENIVGLAFAADHSPLVQVQASDVERFFKAYKKFCGILKRRELQTRFKHEPGVVVVFNNRRMIHSRTEFNTNGGVRYFKELCVRVEFMRSNFMKLADKLGIEVQPPKIGNLSAL